MPVKPFLLVVVDDDAKRFSVEGPMTDDTSWIDRVHAARSAGRNVRCFTTSQPTPAAAAAAMKAQFGFDEGPLGLPAA